MVSAGASRPSRFAVPLSRVPLWLREVLLVAALYGFYELVRGLQHQAPAIAFRNGRDILAWERGLDIDPESWLTHALVHVTPLAVPCAYFYSTAHYLITPIVLVWMYRCHRRQYRTARTALAISTMAALVLFWLVPTAPPRLLRGAHVPDALFDLRRFGWWGGDGSVPRGLGGITNQLAAMPSLHVGWALWSGFLLALYCRNRFVRVLGVLYPLLTTFVVLATGNHYVLDVIVGVAVMAFGAAGAVLARRGVRTLRSVQRRRAAAQDEPVRQPADDAGELITASRAV